MNLDSRIKVQFPVLIVTLLSVLIGLDFSDLVGLMRARMMLWPLEAGSLRTWGQIFTMTGCCLSVWVIFAHTNVSRSRIPVLADSVVVFTMPLSIVVGNSLVGQNVIWPWFWWACAYLVNAIVTWRWQVHIALEEHQLASFARLTHPFRTMIILYFGVPFFAIAALADSRQLLSPTFEALVAWSGGPAAMFTVWLFIREWHSAIADVEAVELQPTPVGAD